MEKTSHLELMRRYRGMLCGSGYLNGYRRNDLDVTLAVPGPEIRSVERMLESLGFQRNQVDLGTCDENVISSFRGGIWDVQICTPAVWQAKRAILRKIKRNGLHVGLSKVELYELYNSMYESELSH